jgi:hypothetical protein
VEKYELIFEGTIDDSMDTLRTLKATLLSDFDLKIADIQRILNEAPTVIVEAQEMTLLSRKSEILKNSGAIVSVRRKSEGNELTCIDAAEAEPLDTYLSSEDELSFELSLDDLSSPATVPSHKVTIPEPTKSWELSIPPELENILDERLDRDSVQADLLTDDDDIDDEDFDPVIPETLTATSVIDVSSTLSQGLMIEEEDVVSTISGQSTTTQSEATAESESIFSLEVNEANDANQSSAEKRPPSITEPSKSSGVVADPVATLKALRAEAPQIPMQTDEEKDDEGSFPSFLDKAPEIPPLSAFSKTWENETRRKENRSTSWDEAEAALTREKVASFIQRRPSRSFFGIITLVLGIGIGGIGWLHRENTIIVSDSAISELIQSQKEVQGKKAIENQHTPQFRIYEGTQKTTEFTAVARCTQKTGEAPHCFIRVETSQPPEETPEEIVNNIPRAPWLRKLEFENGKGTKNEDGSFFYQGQGRLYAEYLRRRERKAADYQLTVFPSPLGNSLEVELTATLNESLTLDQDKKKFIFKAQDGEQLLMRLSTSFELEQKVSPLLE